LEHRILQRIVELDPRRKGLFSISVLELENFYGIEVEDFPHEIAILSLWLAKHQMNAEFEELFGAEIPLIPLRDAGNITCDNAARLDWHELFGNRGQAEIYVLGNPLARALLSARKRKRSAYSPPVVFRHTDSNV
jgi:hypothetical protein